MSRPFYIKKLKEFWCLLPFFGNFISMHTDEIYVKQCLLEIDNFEKDVVNKKKSISDYLQMDYDCIKHQCKEMKNFDIDICRDGCVNYNHKSQADLTIQ